MKYWIGVFLMTLSLSLFADALLSAGKVIAVVGDAFASTEGAAKRTLQRNDDFFQKDVVTTSEGANVSLRFTDGTVVELKGKTSYSIKDYHFNEAEPEKDSFLIELIAGAFRTITGELGKRTPNAYEVKAQMTTLTIQGTAYSMGIYTNVEAFVEEGQVGVGLPNGQVIQLDPAHPGISVNPNGQYQRVSTMPANLISGFQPGGFERMKLNAAVATRASNLKKGGNVRIRGEGRQAPPKKPAGAGACKVSSSGA